MKILDMLKSITLVVLTVIAATISSLAQSYETNNFTFCYRFSESKIILSPTPLASGEKCAANSGYVYAPSYESAKHHLIKANHGYAISDCGHIFHGCMRTIEAHSTLTPATANNICKLKQDTCLNPDDRKVIADLDKQIKSLDPKLATMVKQMPSE